MIIIKPPIIASLIGWAAGLFLMFAGVLVFIITQQWLISLEIVIIGLIIYIAAGYIRRKIKMIMALQSIQAQDIMTGEYPTMTEKVNIGQLIRDHILVKGWHYVIIVDGAKLKGILTMRQIKSVPWKRWNRYHYRRYYDSI